MAEINLGIIGGGQLGSMLSVAAKKLNIKTTIYCDDIDAPAQNFCNEFIFGKYDDKEKISKFIEKVNIITYEFENIPYETLNEINKKKSVLPKPSINRLIQHTQSASLYCGVVIYLVLIVVQNSFTTPHIHNVVTMKTMLKA